MRTDSDSIKELIDRFFADTSQSLETTLDGLEEVRSHVDVLCDSLREDIKRRR